MSIEMRVCRECRFWVPPSTSVDELQVSPLKPVGRSRTTPARCSKVGEYMAGHSSACTAFKERA